MGEAKILMRSDAAVASDPAAVERKLSVPELLWNDGFVRKGAIIVFLARGMGSLRHLPRQSAAVSDLPRHRHHHVREGQGRHHPDAGLGFAEGAVHGLRRRHRARRHLHHPGDLDPDRHRFSGNHDGDVQPAAGDRAVAAGADLVRPRQWQPGVRADPFGAVAGGAQYPFRLQERVEHVAHGRPQLRPARTALRGPHPDSRGVRLDPHGLEDRLGVCVAHPDRGRTGVRRVVGAGRARLVHLREPQSAGYSCGVSPGC